MYFFFLIVVPGIIAAADRLPPGLVLLEDVVDEEYEARLLASIDWQHVDPNIKEGENGRHVMSLSSISLTG